MTVRELLYRGEPRLGRFFTFRLTTLFGLSAIFSLTWLFLPAYLLGVLSFEDGHRHNVGLLYSWNWALMFLVVLPVIFVMADQLGLKANQSLARLTHFRIITATDGSTVTDYRQTLSKRIAAKSRGLILVVLLITLLLLIIDIEEIVKGYFGDGNFSEWDWSVACFMKDPPKTIWGAPISRSLNLMFVGIAYAAEATAIFLGIFVVAKFWLFLKAFADSMVEGPKRKVKFNLLIFDPFKRLGLHSLGTVFNTFLVMALLFQIYICGQRISLIEKRGLPHEQNHKHYLLELWEKKKEPKALRNMGEFQTVKPGMAALLLFGTAPIIVISWVPLVILRAYIRRRKEEVWEEKIIELVSAEQKGDFRAAESTGKVIKALKDSSIWPNGDLAGWTLFTATAVIFVGAIFPPLLIYASACGSLTSIGKWLWGMRKST